MKKGDYNNILKENQDIANRTDFASRYADYNRVDSESAWQHFEEKHLKEKGIFGKAAKTMRVWSRKNISTVIRYAAVALVVAGFSVYFYSQQTPTAIAPISEVKMTKELQANMERAKESGKVGATIIAMSKEEQQDMAEECGLSTEELLEARKITTVQDREYWIRLCDGSMIHINGGTRVIYPEHFYGSTRDIYIEGEAYCMIAEDKEHPFIVHTPHGEVKELGTEFNVNTRNIAEGKEIEQTEVVLVKGSIAVRVNGSEVEHVMSPGDMAVITHDGRIGLDKVDVAPYVAWNTGTFSFKDKSLEDVMNIVGKWYGKDIVFTDQKLRNTLITGTFDRYESIENILSGIGKSTGLDIQSKGGRIIVE